MIVTVVHARPGAQHVIRVELAAGATVGSAVQASGLLQLEPDLARRPLEVGLWNRRVSLDAIVRDGDRIEVYRPLQIEPMEARRLRAATRRRQPKG
jgi:putative ubiquitin-RnfH superfamily antitoxin RatB of RatAB toxin-antitoxin module